MNMLSTDPFHVNPRQKTVEEFNAWLASARRGQRFLFLRGDVIPRLCPVDKAVKAATSAGLIVTVRDIRVRPSAHFADRTDKPLSGFQRCFLGVEQRDAQDADALLSALEGGDGAGVAPPVAALAAGLDIPAYRIRAAFAVLRGRRLISDNLHMSASGAVCRQFTLA